MQHKKRRMVYEKEIRTNVWHTHSKGHHAALNVGASPVEMKEIVDQSVPYVVMSARDFIRVTNEVFKERGIELPIEPQSTTSPEIRFEKGLSAQKTILGDGIDKMYEASPKDLLHTLKFFSANCFGSDYTQKSFDLKMRELITLSIVIAMGADLQVKAYIHGSLNIGATRSE
jgi:4-carboxymuconolactone decarboxylase